VHPKSEKNPKPEKKTRKELEKNLKPEKKGTKKIKPEKTPKETPFQNPTGT
jgi:hypothetical protein